MASVDFKVKNGLVTGANNATLGTAVTVLIGGNVGIGDTNPGYKLAVSGTLNTTGALTQAGNQVLHASNYNSYAPTLTGGNASGTWGISISGTAALATSIESTAQALGYSISAQDVSYGGQGGPQIRAQGSGAAMISFHRPGAYAINLGLGADNQLRTGGWSRGASSFVILDSGNYNSYSPTLTGTGASGNWAINSYNITQYPLNQSVLTTASPTFAALTTTGGITAAGGDITTYRAGGTTGVIYFNSAATRYLYWDASVYQLNGAELNINGNRALNAGNYNSYAVARTSTNRNGVYKLFRNESDDAYNVQTTYGVDRSGYWSLRGYNGDTYHAACYVAYAGTADTATSATSASSATLASKSSTLASGGGNGTAMTFNWSGQSGQPTWLWGGSDGSNMYVYNPSNFSVNYATYSDYTSTRAKTSADTTLATTAFVKSMFYTASTGGVADWNDASNITPGTGQSLLLGNASNGPGPGNYFHPVNFSYSDLGTGGQITQLAIAYASPGNELYMRGRYAGSWSSWTRFLNTGNYNSYSPKLDGTGAYGTWTISVTGSAYDLAGNETNWASYRSRAVANMLAWKNYGSGHVIFDASNSTAPNGASVTNTNPATNWSAGYPTLMGWNGSSTYGVRVDSCRKADSAGSADNAVTITYNSSLNSDSRNSRGVTRLYRRDSDSDYSVQTYHDGTYWRLYGYNGDTAHADTRVGYADSSGFASYSGYIAGGTFCYTTSGLSVGTSSNPYGAGYIVATNDVYAGYSDGRLKKDIKPIANALEKIKQISGITYKNNDIAAEYGYTDTSEQVGVLAQEIQKVLPQVVKPAPFDVDKVNDKVVSKSGENYLTVQYEKIIPLLIEAIKEQQIQIEELKSKVG